MFYPQMYETMCHRDLIAISVNTVVVKKQNVSLIALES